MRRMRAFGTLVSCKEGKWFRHLMFWVVVMSKIERGMNGLKQSNASQCSNKRRQVSQRAQQIQTKPILISRDHLPKVINKQVIIRQATNHTRAMSVFLFSDGNLSLSFRRRWEDVEKSASGPGSGTSIRVYSLRFSTKNKEGQQYICLWICLWPQLWHFDARIRI